MDITQLSPPELLKLILLGMDIKLINEMDDKYFNLEKNYCIEIENPNLYKLSQNNQVIAPFDDLVEMCEFIKNY